VARHENVKQAVQSDADLQRWWDTIQSRNPVFFELITVRLHYVEMPDLYVLILELDDCLDDLDVIMCPPSVTVVCEQIKRAVRHMMAALVHIACGQYEYAGRHVELARIDYQHALAVSSPSSYPDVE
jgi:hypothetical protein